MMRCLASAGLDAIYNPALDRLWSLIGGTPDYNPNPNGFFHLEDYQVDWPTFYDDTKGKLLKIPRASLHMTPPGAYKLIFMVRDPKEIIASMHKFSPFTSWGQMEVNVYLYDLIKKATLDRLSQRDDYDILEIRYADVVTDPLQEFEKIKAFGFPIDINKAAAMVDPSLYRLKLEQR